jgi:hypothetical protein
MALSALEALPTEILYRIIVSVDFSPKNLRALSLTCHRIFDLIHSTDYIKLCGDTAANQYPYALDAQRYPILPFPGHSTIPSFARLNNPSFARLNLLRTASEIVEEEVRLMRELRAVLLKNHPEHLTYLATRGWDYNLRTALHLGMFLRLLNNSVDVRRVFLLRPCPPSPVPSEFSAILNSVPARYILAYRHAACMIAEVEHFVHKRPGHLLHDELLRLGHTSPPSQGRRQKDLRWQLPGAIATEHSIYTHFKTTNETGGTGERRASRIPTVGTQVSWVFRNVQTYNLLIRNAIMESLTQRIRKILDDWDQFSQDPNITENLQPANGIHDIEAVRTLVESFVHPEAATA